MIIENKKAAVKMLISPVIDQWPAVICSAKIYTTYYSWTYRSEFQTSISPNGPIVLTKTLKYFIFNSHPRVSHRLPLIIFTKIEIVLTFVSLQGLIALASFCLFLQRTQTNTAWLETPVFIHRTCWGRDTRFNTTIFLSMHVKKIGTQCVHVSLMLRSFGLWRGALYSCLQAGCSF